MRRNDCALPAHLTCTSPCCTCEPGIPRYLSRAEVSRYLGLKSPQSLSSNTDLPEPDVMVGKRCGWSTETIDAWNAKRRGPGRWGARQR